MMIILLELGEASMKKLLISLVLLIPFVSGCADVDTRVNINDDKSASVVTSLTYQGNLDDGGDIAAHNIKSNYEKFLDKYYDVETTSSPKLSTITATKKVKNLSSEDLDLSSLGFKTNLESGKFIEVKKNFLVKSFNVDMVYDYETIAAGLDLPKTSEASAVNSAINTEYYHQYNVSETTQSDSDSEFDMAANLDDSAKQLAQEDIIDEDNTTTKPTDSLVNTSFSIQAPSFASYNNADNVNGNIYTWEILDNSPTEIKFQYVQYSGWAITLIILVGILLLVYVSRRIIRRDSTKRIDNIENIV